jgi:hypothetical protein
MIFNINEIDQLGFLAALNQCLALQITTNICLRLAFGLKCSNSDGNR